MALIPAWPSAHQQRGVVRMKLGTAECDAFIEAFVKEQTREMRGDIEPVAGVPLLALIYEAFSASGGYALPSWPRGRREIKQIIRDIRLHWDPALQARADEPRGHALFPWQREEPLDLPGRSQQAAELVRFYPLSLWAEEERLIAQKLSKLQADSGRLSVVQI